MLDLFTVDTAGSDAKKKSGGDAGSDGKKAVSMKEIMEEGGDLWDEKQYETEYNLDTFMESLEKKN